MLVPREILKSVPKAAGDDGRYAMGCVELSRRPDGKAEVRATDGRVAVIVSWQDEPGDYPVIDGLDSAPVEGFRALVPSKKFAGLASSMPKIGKDCKPILHNVAFEESDGEHVKAGAVDVEFDQTCVRIRAGAGTHPDIDKVLPDGAPMAKVVINPQLLRQLLEAMKGAIDEASPAVVLEIHDEQTPLVIRSEANGATALGMLMPITPV